jgi:hypothetical protein
LPLRSVLLGLCAAIIEKSFTDCSSDKLSNILAIGCTTTAYLYIGA